MQLSVVKIPKDTSLKYSCEKYLIILKETPAMMVSVILDEKDLMVLESEILRASGLPRPTPTPTIPKGEVEIEDKAWEGL